MLWILGAVFFVACGDTHEDDSENFVDQSMDMDIEPGLFARAPFDSVVPVSEVTPPVTLAKAMHYLSLHAQSGYAYTIVLQADETVSSYTLSADSLNGAANGAVEIRSRKHNTFIRLKNTPLSGSLFNVAAGISLTVGTNIVLAGNGLSPKAEAADQSSLPLLIVGGELTLSDNALITGNVCTFNGFVTADFPGQGFNTRATGGAVYVRPGGKLALEGSAAITKCRAAFGGAVFAAEDAVVTLSGTSRISGNTAHGQGGGIFLWRSSLALADAAEILENTAVQGGGIYADGTGLFPDPDVPGSTVTLRGRSRVALNTTRDEKVLSAKGGGIFINSGIVSVAEHAGITGNTVVSTYNPQYWGNGAYGGGVFVAPYCALEVSGNALVTGNTAFSPTDLSRGGGIYQEGAFVLTGAARVSGNSAGIGGGVYALGNFTKNGNSVIFGSEAAEGNKNTAVFSGSAVFADNSRYSDDSPPRRENTAGAGVNLYFTPGSAATPESHWTR